MRSIVQLTITAMVIMLSLANIIWLTYISEWSEPTRHILTGVMYVLFFQNCIDFAMKAIPIIKSKPKNEWGDDI